MKKFLLVTIIALITNTSLAADDEAKAKFMAVNHFVNDNVFGNIYELAKKYDGHEDQERQYSKELQNLYCNGTIPRFIVKKTVVFKTSIDDGMPLDYAAEQAFLQTEMAKFFYKNDFLYSSGWGHDLSQYLLHRSYLPDDTNNDAHYISASAYRNFTFKYKQLALDMGFLIKHFTFKIPQELVSSMYDTKDDMFKMDKFGYKNGSFHASEVINFKDYVWRYVLIHDTQVKRALKDDGSVVYEINWIPNLFCHYGIPVSALKSQ